jgi:hypothetical protein
MAARKILSFLALATLPAGCIAHPVRPVAALHLPQPMVVQPTPVVVAPAYYRPHPGDGWRHGHRHRHHD